MAQKNGTLLFCLTTSVSVPNGHDHDAIPRTAIGAVRQFEQVACCRRYRYKGFIMRRF